MSKIFLPYACLFCENTYCGVEKFHTIEQYDGGNTIRYDLTSFLGHESEDYLQPQDMLCCRCMRFFGHLAHTKRRLLDFLRHRDEPIGIKVEKFNSIWDEYTNFAGNLVNFSLYDSEEPWDARLRSETPNPAVLSHYEKYDPKKEKKIEIQQNKIMSGRKSSMSTTSETDREVSRYNRKRRSRSKRWTRTKGEAQSRARSEAYPSFSEIASKRRCYSRPEPVAVRDRIRTRSVSRGDKEQRDRIIKSQSPSFQCDKCETNFSKLDELEQHQKIEHIVSFQCDTCKVRFSNFDNLRKHKKLKHSGEKTDSFQCDKCAVSCVTLEKLVGHKKLEHAIIPRFKCSQCDNAEYTTREELIIHNRSHDKEVLHCFFCRRELIGTEEYQAHLRQHQEKSSECAFCSLSFITEEELMDHCYVFHRGKRTTVHEQATSKVLEQIVNKEKLNIRNVNNNISNSAETLKINYKAKEFKMIICDIATEPSPDRELTAKETLFSKSPAVKLITYNTTSGRQSTVSMNSNPGPISIGDSSFGINDEAIAGSPITVADTPVISVADSPSITINSGISPQKDLDLSVEQIEGHPLDLRQHIRIIEDVIVTPEEQKKSGAMPESSEIEIVDNQNEPLECTEINAGCNIHITAESEIPQAVNGATDQYEVQESPHVPVPNNLMSIPYLVSVNQRDETDLQQEPFVEKQMESSVFPKHNRTQNKSTGTKSNHGKKKKKPKNHLKMIETAQNDSTQMCEENLLLLNISNVQSDIEINNSDVEATSNDNLPEKTQLEFPENADQVADKISYHSEKKYNRRKKSHSKPKFKELNLVSNNELILEDGQIEVDKEIVISDHIIYSSDTNCNSSIEPMLSDGVTELPTQRMEKNTQLSDNEHIGSRHGMNETAETDPVVKHQQLTKENPVLLLETAKIQKQKTRSKHKKKCKHSAGNCSKSRTKPKKRTLSIHDIDQNLQLSYLRPVVVVERLKFGFL